MTEPVDSLAMRASSAVARRQRHGRLARWLALPTLLGALWLGRFGEWLAVAGLGIVVLLLIVITIGMYQKCPRCRAPLVTQHIWGKGFAPTCPECGCPID